MRRRVEAAVEARAWLCTFNHGIARPDGRLFDADRTYSAPDRRALARHYAWLRDRSRAGDVWVAPVSDVAVYARVRDAAVLRADGGDRVLLSSPAACATDAESVFWRREAVAVDVARRAGAWDAAEWRSDGGPWRVARRVRGAFLATVDVRPCDDQSFRLAWRAVDGRDGSDSDGGDAAVRVLERLGVSRAETPRLLAELGDAVDFGDRERAVWREGGPLAPEVLLRLLYGGGLPGRWSADLGRDIATIRGEPVARATVGAWIAGVAPLLDPPRRCLEWAAGPWAYAASHFGCEAVDTFEYRFGDSCGGRVGAFRSDAGAAVLCGDLEDPAALAFAAGEYDLVVCTYVFNMLPGADAKAAAKAVATLLAPGGSLLWAAPFASPSLTVEADVLRFTPRSARALFAAGLGLCLLDAAVGGDEASTLAALAGFAAEDAPASGAAGGSSAVASAVFAWALKPSLAAFRGCDGFAARSVEGSGVHRVAATAEGASSPAEAPPATASSGRSAELRLANARVGAGLAGAAAARDALLATPGR